MFFIQALSLCGRRAIHLLVINGYQADAEEVEESDRPWVFLNLCGHTWCGAGMERLPGVRSVEVISQLIHHHSKHSPVANAQTHTRMRTLVGAHTTANTTAETHV